MTIERPVFFPCGDAILAGVLTEPDRPNGRCVLIPWGGGAFPSSGPNRIRTRLARTLAERGFYSLRFDYRGVGESEGEYRLPSLVSPYTEEIIAAGNWLTSQEYGEMIVVANCFGAWSSLMAAPKIQNLYGIVLVNSPVGRDHHQAKGVQGSWKWWAKRLRHLNWSQLRNRYRRAAYRKMVIAKASFMVRGAKDHGFAGGIRALVDRGVPLLLLYGQDDFRADFILELDRGITNDLVRAAQPTRVVMVEERLEGYASFAAQDALLVKVPEWLAELSDVNQKESSHSQQPGH